MRLLGRTNPAVRPHHLLSNRLSRYNRIAMRLWLSRHSGITLQQQLVTQIRLGILSEELAAGQKLPSVRQLARRLKVHTNTIHAAYGELKLLGLIEMRGGSGSFVLRPSPERDNPSSQNLDNLVATLFHAAGIRGFSRGQVRSAMDRYLAHRPPDHFLLVEPDLRLREILLHELQAMLTLPVEGCGTEECRHDERRLSAVILVRPRQLAAVRSILPSSAEVIQLTISSVHDALQAHLPAPPNPLVAVASGWPEFLAIAQTMLLAAGLHPDALVMRDTAEPGWDDDIRRADCLICDRLTADRAAGIPHLIPFDLIAESTRKTVQLHEEWIKSPLSL